MEASYACTFPESFKIMNIFLGLPIGITSVEQSFSHLKMIKQGYTVAYQTVVLHTS